MDSVIDIEEKFKKAKIRLERCKDCPKPTSGPTGSCPGNMGIGCFGDWRCCLEMDSVCKDCDNCDNCDKLDCNKMNKFQTEYDNKK